MMLRRINSWSELKPGSLYIYGQNDHSTLNVVIAIHTSDFDIEIGLSNDGYRIVLESSKIKQPKVLFLSNFMETLDDIYVIKE